MIYQVGFEKAAGLQLSRAVGAGSAQQARERKRDHAKRERESKAEQETWRNNIEEEVTWKKEE